MHVQTHTSVLRPSAPTTFTVYSFQSTSVTITWSQLSMVVINSYSVGYMRTGGCTLAPSGDRTDIVSPYTLTGLEENIEYEITVTARNTMSNSDAAATTATTLSASELDNGGKIQYFVIYINFQFLVAVFLR